MRIRRLPLLLATVLFTGACAPPSATSSGAQHNMVTAEELSRVQNTNLYDALRQIRPAFLRSRTVSSATNEAQPIQVYLDGTRMEGVDYLKQIPTTTVKSVQFLEPQQANARFGGNNSGGALLVTTR